MLCCGQLVLRGVLGGGGGGTYPAFLGGLLGRGAGLAGFDRGVGLLVIR